MTAAGADPRSPTVHGPDRASAPLNAGERRQLGRLRRWGTVGALLMMVGSTSSYGAANPNPNPLDGSRIVGLLSRIGPAALACSYSGIGLLVLCWFLIGRLAVPGRTRRLSRTQLTHTLAMWAVPLLVTPPIFSRDVYSYLAVGSMMVQGDNPYRSGPYDALGDDNPFAHQVDARWQHTTTPYGPAFLLVAKAVAAIAGHHVTTGVLLQRFVELIGVAAIVWALPRLARRCGIDPVGALWLGALNPLVLFHLVAGGHNEALMIGAMLVGLVVAVGHSEPDRAEHRIFRLAPWLRPVLGGACLAFAIGVKATAGLGLVFLVILLARRAGGRWSDLWRYAAVVGGAALLTFGALTLAAGFGLGWVSALGTPGTVRSFLSISTTLGVGAGWLGMLLGLGEHTQAAVDVMQPVGTIAGGLVAAWIAWRCWRPWRGRTVMDPLLGLGLAFGAFVLLGPVIQPWYLLWAAIPLAAATGWSRYRRVTVWLTTIFSVIIMPNGGTILPFTIVVCVLVAAVVVATVLFWLHRTGLPPRMAGDPSPIPAGEPTSEPEGSTTYRRDS